MKKINVLVMPTDVCNMSCVYCFHNTYRSKEGLMSYDTLKKMYDIIFKSYDDVQFIWHGGEPLCMGMDFYYKAINMQQEYPNKRIVNRMQSNLTLLTEELADFLCENSIGVGTSFDGIENEKTRGYSEKILAGRQLLIERGQSCGFIMVLSNININTLIESYEMFKELNANYNMNTYVSTASTNNEDLTLDPEVAIHNLKDLFEHWIADSYCNIHVDYFERYIKYILFGEKGVCKYNSCLGKWVGIRFDGSIVPCNRYFPEEYCYGNVWDYDAMEEAFKSKGFEKLLSAAIERRYKCQECEIYDFCTGGCNNVALNETGINSNNGTTCHITKEIYKYIMNFVIEYKKSDIEVSNPILERIMKTKRKRKDKNCNHQDVHTDSFLV